jgi:hypothetical protein
VGFLVPRLLHRPRPIALAITTTRDTRGLALRGTY